MLAVYNLTPVTLLTEIIFKKALSGLSGSKACISGISRCFPEWAWSASRVSVSVMKVHAVINYRDEDLATRMIGDFEINEGEPGLSLELK